MSEEILFSRLLDGLICAPCIRVCYESSTTKNQCPVSPLSVVSKIFVKCVNNRLVDLEKYDLFLLSSVVSGLLDQLETF